MHPIFFRIPLPHMPLKLWWLLAGLAALFGVFGIVGVVRKAPKDEAVTPLLLAVVLGGAGFWFRGVSYEAATLPIYAYGVMLGLSLIVGWYITLPLAKRDGLPPDTMANCYVVTALAALFGSRALYILTNVDEFKQAGDVFALRGGGLVAYGGFLGGFFGSWLYLAGKKIRLMPWADVAVPSLAAGLMVTRIGCYLFGCDFGKPLAEAAPSWLKNLGTFPHWPEGTLTAGDGSPAFVRHLSLYRGTELGEKIQNANASLPVHPTQLYESLAGLFLLILVLAIRPKIKFRGQVFFTFAFGYGVVRFALEMLRDDTERGTFGPWMAEHVALPGAFLAFAIAYTVGLSLSIANPAIRTVTRVLSFVPCVVALIALHPPAFAPAVDMKLSTSQWIAVITAVLVSVFYMRFFRDAARTPLLAMSLGEFEEIERAKAKADTAADEDDVDTKGDDVAGSADGNDDKGEPAKA
jgi:phosphatidylglycerol:prolipoprotein diacylglycerol transferase